MEYVPDEVVEEEQQSDEVVMTSDKHISLVGRNLQSIPVEVARRFPDCKSLDLSHNSITSLQGLEHFKSLTSLVLDDNEVGSEEKFPNLAHLTSLTVNSNCIKDLEPFISGIETSLPALTYLSMLKNPACPNFFTGKEQEDYQRYRYFVLHKLKNLKFLDSTPVKDEERKEAQRVGHLMVIAKPDTKELSKQKPKEENQEDMEFRPLPSTVREPGATRASFGVSRYVYYGRQSEGNRFISNSDL